MKLIIAALLAIATLAGCAIPVRQASPAQILTQINMVICPGSQAVLTTLQIPGLIINPSLAAQLPMLQRDAAAVCADGASLNSANLDTLLTSSLPIILSIVQAVPGPQQAPAIAAIAAAQLLLPILIAQVKALEATAPLPTTKLTAIA